MKKIPFSPPRMDQKIIDEVTDTLWSGWITTGPKTKSLEKKVAEMVNVPKVLCVNSATSGLDLVLRWLGVGAGDEVIVPAYTYCATANVVVHCGAKPIMVDCLKEDFTFDINAIEKAITSKTKVIMPVDLGGMPVHYEALYDLIKKNEVTSLFSPNNDIQKKLGRIAIVSDAAHSIGAIYNNKPAAAFTDFAVFSFHAVKNLTTAEGGAICINLPNDFDATEVYKSLNTSSLHGQNKDAMAKFKANSWEYDVEFPGRKCNMPDILASIGLVEIDRYKETLARRKEIFDLYNKLLSKYNWAELPIYEDQKRTSSYHLYLLRINEVTKTQRDDIISKIFEQQVSVNVHYKPLPLLTAYKNMGYQMDHYPVAEDAFNRVITLPVYFDLSDEDVNIVVQAIASAVIHVLANKPQSEATS